MSNDCHILGEGGPAYVYATVLVGVGAILEQGDRSDLSAPWDRLPACHLPDDSRPKSAHTAHMFGGIATFDPGRGHSHKPVVERSDTHRHQVSL